MTSADRTPIASKIADEHEFGMFQCQCGEPVSDWNHGTRREMRELHTAHVARVAEAAVRARIVTDIEAARPARAEAWDEGYLAGYRDRREERDYDPGQNPYRTADRPSVTDNARADITERAYDEILFYTGCNEDEARETVNALTAAGLLATPAPDREAVRKALASAIWNASNHPDPTAVMGRPFDKLLEACIDAVHGLLGGQSRE